MTKERCIEYIREDMRECEKYGHHDEALGLMYSIGYIEQINEPYWHNVLIDGVPKESGYYLGVDYEHENEPYCFWVDSYDDCDFTDLMSWHKIESCR